MFLSYGHLYIVFSCLSSVHMVWLARLWLLNCSVDFTFTDDVTNFKFAYRRRFNAIDSQATYVGVSKSFRTDRLELELQMVQLSATRCSCIAIL
jgi:hypothetical protein